VCSSALLGSKYAPLQLPNAWTFTIPTPAYNPQAPTEKLGDFQPGIRVAVIGPAADRRHWLVEYERIGFSNIHALIPIPDLSKVDPYAFASVQPFIDAFPILRKQLESDRPWPAQIQALATRLFTQGARVFDGNSKQPTLFVANDATKDAVVWGMAPLKAAIDFHHPEHPKIVIELWNKADASQSAIGSQPARTLIEDRLAQLEKAFVTYQGQNARNGDSSGITAVGNDAQHYFLPNNIKISVRYRSNEYLIIAISPFTQSSQTPTDTYDPETFAQTLRARVRTHPDGYAYISGLPMITQGDKGYCAAATLARILKFYGYPVDMHAMADLAETEGQTGTRYAAVIASIRRVCSSTPFKIKQLKNVRRADVLATIETGVPIYWLVPGHARLIIGVHPQGGIVYSDSWGPGHAFKTMSWGQFKMLNREMWILQPKN